MLDAFREGGWGMYPTMVLGLVALATMVRATTRPEKTVTPAVALSVATLISGMLGFLTGTIRTFQAVGAVEPSRQFGLMLAGLGESLHNVTFALVFLVLLTIVYAVQSHLARARFS